MRALAVVACLLLLLVACGCAPTEPKPPTGPRTWRGPTDTVASRGVTVYDRRTIAQKVNFPTCVAIAGAAFRLESVDPQPAGSPIPTGVFDTGYSLDRWRLLAAAGALSEQQTLYVTVGGSTGILGRYPRLPAGQPC